MEKKDKIETAAVDTNGPHEKSVPGAPVADPWTEAVGRIVRAEDSDPFQILGPHWIDRDGKRVLAIRAFRPGATGATILWGARATVPSSQIDPGGLFEAIVPSDVTKLRGDEPVPANAYRIQFHFADGNALETHDPYAFPPLLTDYDLYLSGEGTHYQNYEKLGAHVREVAGVRGVHFAVWAPNAQRVSVVGRFQSLGRPRASDAHSRRERHLGNFHAGAGRRRALQIRDSLARRSTTWD